MYKILKEYSTGCPKKKVAIGLPKPQFLSETFEILVLGGLFLKRI